MESCDFIYICVSMLLYMCVCVCVLSCWRWWSLMYWDGWDDYFLHWAKLPPSVVNAILCYINCLFFPRLLLLLMLLLLLGIWFYSSYWYAIAQKQKPTRRVVDVLVVDVVVVVVVIIRCTSLDDASLKCSSGHCTNGWHTEEWGAPPQQKQNLPTNCSNSESR